MKEIKRLKKLEALIKKTFDHLHSDDVEYSGIDFEHSTTQMIELITLNKDAAIAADLFDDLIFEPIILSKEFAELLRPGDVFLATLGFKEDAWHALHLSQRYTTEKIDY